MQHLTRRRFLKTSAVLAGTPMFMNTSGVLGANERLRVAVVGLNSRGKSHIGGYLGQKDVEVAALVDPDTKVLASRVADVGKRSGKEPAGYADIRKLLEDRTIDAISIATPNHWHALMTIWGAQAGKHVYVEKPMSHDITEGRVAVAAQEKYGVVIQHGTQRRSSSNEAGLAQAIKAGKFGKLKISYGYCCKPRKGIGHNKIAQSPANLDWDLWRGPADIGEYHGNYVHYDWHWFWAT
ncbi:MAG: Gfo/Idh/MocA family protein, partial [Phycisphaeraceae bacterium]